MNQRKAPAERLGDARKGVKMAILDLDTGIDDVLALAYALGSPELDVIGVTGTYGNVVVPQGVANNLSVLELFNRPDIPVFSGQLHVCDKEEFSVLDISRLIHGDNGIGNVELPKAAKVEGDKSAVEFLVESVREYGDDLVIIPAGPLTNIAAAIEADPNFADNAHIVCMGGALTVPGNVSTWAEANINQDPVAADKVLRGCQDVTMIGLDVTLQTLLTYAETSQWRELGNSAGHALAEMTDYYIHAYDVVAPHLGGCGLHDRLAVGVAIDPTLVTTIAHNMKVDTEGPTRGRTIGDETRLNDPNKNCKVAVGVDVDRFLGEFMTRIGACAKGSEK